jgi:hypothetical protein
MAYNSKFSIDLTLWALSNYSMVGSLQFQTCLWRLRLLKLFQGVQKLEEEYKEEDRFGLEFQLFYG